MPDRQYNFRPLTAALAILSIIYIFIQWHCAGPQPPASFSDTTSYVNIFQNGLTAHWFGNERPFSYPLLLWALHYNFFLVSAFQRLTSALCWLAGAWLLGALFRVRAARIAVFLLILITSLTLDIRQWDHYILTESLSISLFVLLLALFAKFIQHAQLSQLRLTILLFFALYFSFLRDVNTFVLLMLAFLLVLESISIRSCNIVAPVSSAETPIIPVTLPATAIVLKSSGPDLSEYWEVMKLDQFDFKPRFIDKRSWNDAIKELEELYRQSPKNADVLNLLGWAQFHHNQIDNAFMTWQKARVLNPKDEGIRQSIFKARMFLGRRYRGKAMYTAALVQFKALGIHFPENAEITHEIAKTYEQKGDHRNALREYAKLENLHSDISQEAIHEERVREISPVLASENFPISVTPEHTPFPSPPAPRRPIFPFLIAAALLAISLLQNLDIKLGLRYWYNLDDELNLRIFNNADTAENIENLAWLHSHFNLPDEARARAGKSAEVLPPLSPAYRHWIDTVGLAAWRSFLIHHPGWMLRVYFTPPCIYGEAGAGYFQMYAPQWRGTGWEVPVWLHRQIHGLLDPLLSSIGLIFLLIALFAASLAAAIHTAWREKNPTSCPLAQTFALLSYTALIMLFLAKFGDAIEDWRHALLGLVAVYLIFILLIGTLIEFASHALPRNRPCVSIPPTTN